MQQSSELKDLYPRICEAMSTGDHAFFEHLFSQQDGVLAIGTDPMEWWADYDTIVRVFREQMEEVDGFQIFADTPLAYCNGSVGWLAGRPTLKLQDGTTLPVRLTAVLQREADDWKVVQWHFSNGTTNEALLGEALTVQ